jgi:hypothetical protein
MKSVYCVCGKTLGYKPGDGISHGNCEKCAADTLNEPRMWEVWYRQHGLACRMHVRANNSTQANMRAVQLLNDDGVVRPFVSSVKPVTWNDIEDWRR